MVIIAGTPSMDEEEISDDEYDSESDDKLADLIDNGENIPAVLGDQLPTSPPPSIALLIPLTVTQTSSCIPLISQPPPPQYLLPLV